MVEILRTGLKLGIVVSVGIVAAACGDDTTDDATADGASDKLVIAAYGGVTAPLQKELILEPFSEETGIEVQVETVPGEQLPGIAAQNEAGNIQWDMTLSLADSDYATMLAEGFLATMPEDTKEKIAENIPHVASTGVPSRNGAVQVICNVKLAERCPTNAAELFDTENFPGDRMFPSFQPLELMALALQADGVPTDEIFPEDEAQARENVERAIELLNELKPHIKVFYSSSTEAIQLLSRGEVVTGGLWNGSAEEAEPTDKMELVTTWDGAVKYSQWDVVYKGAPNEENAWKLLEWINDHPEASAAFLEGAPAGTTDARVFDLLPPHIQEQLPPADAEPPLAETSSVWYRKDPELQKTIDDFWKDFTQG